MGRHKEAETDRIRVVSAQSRPTEEAGCRQGRPIEDPEKTKTWGYITARPSEYLVHVRKGKVRKKSSGQGATCFNRAHYAVAVIPTSLQRLQFQADQITIEKIGLAVMQALMT